MNCCEAPFFYLVLYSEVPLGTVKCNEGQCSIVGFRVVHVTIVKQRAKYWDTV